MMAKFKTVKRNANVGERILITDATQTDGKYTNGDILTVRQTHAVSWREGSIYVNEFDRHIYVSEYEVIVEPSEASRISALETEVAEQRKLVAKLQAEVDTLKQFPCIERESTAERLQTPNEKRADVIKRAKEFVADLTKRASSDDRNEDGNTTFENFITNTEFHVNNDKRTVVALSKWAFNGSIKEKGIAKCDPADVFNADIGKAIALARALGVEVPTEFVKAVQPTEVVVGMRVGSIRDSFDDFTVDNVKPHYGYREIYDCDGTWADADSVLILDDTDADYVRTYE